VKVEVVSTKASLSFFDKQEVEHRGARVWTDEDEWTVCLSQILGCLRVGSLPDLQGDFKIGDPILHIELRRWADVVLVAPCSANTLAKIAHGLCDNLVVRLFGPSPSYAVDSF
jgi:phosphopantothenoylcysteine decarboxylase